MTPDALTTLIDATWPAASFEDVGPWTIRDGKGGGSRVSAATARNDEAITDIGSAERAMTARGQTPLYMVRSGEDALDAALAARDYDIKDPVVVYSAPVATLAHNRPPPVTTFEVWPQLACQEEIWATGGIDTPRLEVMARASAPKTTILGRLDDTPAGTLFAAVHNNICMLHAIETAHRFRRRGLARHMMTASAFWAQSQGAEIVALLVTRANDGANRLYASMGMQAVEGYHYRIKTTR
ncbi:MAG: GNAT family N-acetyltransferase [Pseudomonadota bacterium]